MSMAPTKDACTEDATDRRIVHCRMDVATAVVTVFVVVELRVLCVFVLWREL